jgi:cell surface protein SprA
MAIPLPNWNLTYSGLSDWPILRSLTQSATLRHGYSATYDLSYRSFSGGGDTRTIQLQRPTGGPQTFTLIPEDEPTLRADEPRVNQRFQPLVGVDLNFRGGIQTNINWNTSATHGLSTVNARLTESQTDELSLRLSLTRSGFRLPLPFISRRLNNQLRLSLVVSRAQNSQRAFTLRDDLQAQLANDLFGTELPETFLSPLPEATIRTTVEPQMSYTLSSAVTASFFMRYEHFESENSRIPTTTNINGGFSFRVSFSN